MDRNMFNLAIDVATKRIDKRTFLVGAVGIRHDGALVTARNESTIIPSPTCHAEYRLCRKLGLDAPVVYVARFSPAFGLGMAQPCPACEAILRNHRVRRVYYTIAGNDWGFYDL